MATDKEFISCIIITHNRKKELKECIDSILVQDYPHYEIIVIDNNSDDGTWGLFEDYFNKFNEIRYVRLRENKGVAGGRNEGIRLAKGDISVFIDDDAVIQYKDSFEKIAAEFRGDAGTGILAFKSLNYYSREINRYEFPHIDKSINPDLKFETSYFVGVGHAITMNVFKRIGLYPEDYIYGGEELDLSFRTLDAGFNILYLPDVVVLHKKSIEGRFDELFTVRKIFENRIKTSVRNLPWRHVFINVFAFLALITLKYRVNPLISFDAFKNIFFDMPALLSQRKVINRKTVRKLKQLRGRLYY